jgi:cholesterol oxidase
MTLDATIPMGDVRFTEEMTGFFTPGAPAWDAGFHTGRADGTTLMFHLTIGTDDVHAFLADPRHACPAVGWVGCPTLGGPRLAVERGMFNLFAPGTAPGRLAMHYRLWFRSSAAAPLTLVGFKDVGNDPGFDLWHDTTTLYTTIFEGHVEEGEDAVATEEGRGILVIEPAMFARQLTTFRGRPRPLARFAGMFAGSLVQVYGRPPPRRTRV